MAFFTDRSIWGYLAFGWHFVTSFFFKFQRVLPSIHFKFYAPCFLLFISLTSEVLQTLFQTRVNAAGTYYATAYLVVAQVSIPVDVSGCSRRMPAAWTCLELTPWSREPKGSPRELGYHNWSTCSSNLFRKKERDTDWNWGDLQKSIYLLTRMRLFG